MLAVKRKLRVFARRLALVLVVLGAAYAVIALHPSLLFAHERRVGAVVLHARSQLPPGADDLARRVEQRLAGSPYFSAEEAHHVYLCDTRELFAFFALWNAGAGAIAQTGTNGDVFVRPHSIERDRLVGPRGRDVPGERTLTYFVAHEVAHTITARRLGRVAYHRLEVWQQEGYADHVGKGGDFDFDGARAKLRAGDPSLDPAAYGLYLRYQLLFEHMLRRGATVEKILGRPRAAEEIEAELLAP
jgi:hypothetical protein